MNILRAHNYQDVEVIRNELSRLPPALADLVSDLPFIILPDSLSPVWIGLMVDESDTSDGRSYSDLGGWYSAGEHPNWKQGRHVFMKPESAWATIHEVGHAIDDTLSYPSKSMFSPELALYRYMATNPDEYFACAFDAYLHEPRDDSNWNRDHLAKSDSDIYEYFRALAGSI